MRAQDKRSMGWRRSETELPPYHPPQDNGTNEYSAQNADDNGKRTDVEGKAFGMRCSAPHIAKEPKREARIGHTQDNTPWDGKEHNAECFLEQDESDALGFIAQLPIKLYLCHTLREHFHQRILKQQNGSKNDEEA